MHDDIAFYCCCVLSVSPLNLYTICDILHKSRTGYESPYEPYTCLGIDAKFLCFNRIFPPGTIACLYLVKWLIITDTHLNGVCSHDEFYEPAKGYCCVAPSHLRLKGHLCAEMYIILCSTRRDSCALYVVVGVFFPWDLARFQKFELPWNSARGWEKSAPLCVFSFAVFMLCGVNVNQLCVCGFKCSPFLSLSGRNAVVLCHSASLISYLKWRYIHIYPCLHVMVSSFSDEWQKRDARWDWEDDGLHLSVECSSVVRSGINL